MDDIRIMLNYTPEEKQERINTLYEAIQLYQTSMFRGVIDNIDYLGKGCKWEFKKPGYHSVRTNEGCCSSDSNWLAYILKGKYEQLGFLNYSQKNSSGHVINYIYHNNWYYFIDMMMYRVDSLPFAGIETGTESGYKGGIYLLGNFHRARTPQSFINYCLSKLRDKPVLFVMLLQDEIVSLGAGFRMEDELSEENSEEVYYKILTNGYDVFYPKDSKAVVLYKDANSSVGLSFSNPPNCLQNWNEHPA